MRLRDPRALLREAGLTPKKSFGQNFLVAENVTRAIAQACVPDEERGRANVLELGAGLGALTAALLERAAHVTAVERDRDLVPLLARTFAGALEDGKLALLEADAQSIDLAAWCGPRSGEAGDVPSEAGDVPSRVLCGNLPYQITGRLLELAVGAAPLLDRVVFMVQEEVADRLLAQPGTKAYGALTVFTRLAFGAARLMKVGPGSFHPRPEVTSAVVVLTPHRPPLAEETETLRAVVKAAFAMRRKTLRNAWRGLVADPDGLGRVAARAGVSLDARGETLDPAAFARVASALEAYRSS